MRARRWMLCLLLGLAFLPGWGMHAQNPDDYAGEPSAEKIARWLRSADPHDVAWGAYYVLKTKKTTFLPELEELAERWEPLPPLPADWSEPPDAARGLDVVGAMAAVLDAVIQMHGQLTPEALLNLANDLPAQATILLARLPALESQAVLLKLYNDPKPQVRYLPRVAAQMLALAPPPGFAASLMKGQVWATVYVTAPGMLVGESGDSGGCRDRQTSPRVGWPTVGLYKLREAASDPDEDAAEPGGFKVIAGRHPLDGWRIESGWWVPMRCDLGELTEATRLQLIAQMLGVEDDALPIHAFEPVEIGATSTRRSICASFASSLRRSKEGFLRWRQTSNKRGS